MTQHVLKGISVKAVPANPKKPCDGCVFALSTSTPSCPLKYEELKAGFDDACYNTNVVYVKDKFRLFTAYATLVAVLASSFAIVVMYADRYL